MGGMFSRGRISIACVRKGTWYVVEGDQGRSDSGMYREILRTSFGVTTLGEYCYIILRRFCGEITR